VRYKWAAFTIFGERACQSSGGYFPIFAAITAFEAVYADLEAQGGADHHPGFWAIWPPFGPTSAECVQRVGHRQIGQG